MSLLCCLVALQFFHHVVLYCVMMHCAMLCMFVACGIWCLADVSSVSPSSEQTMLCNFVVRVLILYMVC